MRHPKSAAAKLPRLVFSFASLAVAGPLAVSTVAATYTTESTGSLAPASFENRQPFLAVTEAVRVSGPVDTLGDIHTFAGNVVPAGYLPADGRLLPTAGNEQLADRLNRVYGSGMDSFALPDLRGRVATGANGSLGRLGTTGGSDTNTLTVANLPAHSHVLPTPTSNGATATESAGNGRAYSTVQRYLALNYRIATAGTYANIASNQVPASPFRGEMVLTASTRPPAAGQADADGAPMTFATNPELGVTIGNLYDTSFGNLSTYSLPDLRGRVAVGSGTENGRAPYVVGTVNGTSTTTLTTAQMPAHAHALTEADSGGPDGRTTVVGANFPVDNLQPSLTMSYLIATTGDYPDPLLADTDERTPYLGEIKLFAGNFAPAGYALCDGRLMSVTQNPLLFTVLGNAYGGDGISTFALPNLQGRVVVGADGQDYLRGTAGGVASYSLTLDNLPAHSHAITPEPASLAVFATAATTLLARRRRH